MLEIKIKHLQNSEETITRDSNCIGFSVSDLNLTRT